MPQYTAPEFARNATPIMITPSADSNAESLRTWIQAHTDDIQDRLAKHGAILFRGFDIHDAPTFEQLALELQPNLQNQYLGTSPRNAVTKYVFSASELPDYYPIPQHCEMSFLRDAPSRVLFFCEIEPESIGGETPLTDFKAVADELNPAVRSRFERRQLRIIRNYTGPNSKNRDLWQLKPWHEMFQTADKDAVDEACKREGFDRIWRDDDRLTLISYQPAFREHPETGEVVWFNHSQVFHIDTAEAELRRVARVQKDWRAALLAMVSDVVIGVRKRTTDAELQPMHVTWADGGEIDAADMEHVRDVIWRNTVRFRWKKGDFVLIDNRRVAHGRMPYRGPRRVLVAWA